MASFSGLKNEARTAGQGTTDSTVAKLAEIIVRLCGECEGLERTAKEALDEAKRAKREARK